MIPDIRQRMQNALDIIRPDWFIAYATQQELAECARACTDGHSGTIQAKNKLRRDVCERMFDILRAGVQADIVEYALPQDKETEVANAKAP